MSMRRVDNLSASPATYLDWIMKDRLLLTDREIKNYISLFNILFDMDFVWIHPLDENRASDGLALRSDFEYETGMYISGLQSRCTVFEMLAALAIRCENQLMRNFSMGDRTAKWFFMMLENLTLTDYDNRHWNASSRGRIVSIIDDFLKRKYKKNGEGGAFPLKHSKNNQANEQIWDQLMAYINENYSEDDEDLELFR